MQLLSYSLQSPKHLSGAGFHARINTAAQAYALNVSICVPSTLSTLSQGGLMQPDMHHSFTTCQGPHEMATTRSM